MLKLSATLVALRLPVWLKLKLDKFKINLSVFSESKISGIRHCSSGFPKIWIMESSNFSFLITFQAAKYTKMLNFLVILMNRKRNEIRVPLKGRVTIAV